MCRIEGLTNQAGVMPPMREQVGRLNLVERTWTVSRRSCGSSRCSVRRRCWNMSPLTGEEGMMARIEALVRSARSCMGNGTSERSTSVLSHKLITYLKALIPSCPARRGSGCSGGSQAPGRGSIGLLLRDSVHKMTSIYGCLCAFILNDVIDVISVRCICTLVFAGAALPYGTAAPHRQGASPSGCERIDALFYAIKF